ncbi:hypothetical protein HK096_005861 [Nowakowskiella sp. JEL0078]|nr:hypothetical protein HK096_005861 [Nowakowskiella sp. JEL0078]
MIENDEFFQNETYRLKSKARKINRDGVPIQRRINVDYSFATPFFSTSLICSTSETRCYDEKDEENNDRGNEDVSVERDVEEAAGTATKGEASTLAKEVERLVADLPRIPVLHSYKGSAAIQCIKQESKPGSRTISGLYGVGVGSETPECSRVSMKRVSLVAAMLSGMAKSPVSVWTTWSWMQEPLVPHSIWLQRLVKFTNNGYLTFPGFPGTTRLERCTCKAVDLQ